jgi:hypothetical protein
VPKVELFLEDLVEVFENPELAETGMEGLADDLLLFPGHPLTIKPAAEGSSLGVMRLERPGDLVLYATAVAQQWDEIPAELNPDGAFCSRRPFSS